MELSQQQREAVSQWISAGDSLAVVQRKLTNEFNVSMTYMQVRFLVDDLGLDLKSPEKPKPIVPTPPPAATDTPVGLDAESDANSQPDDGFADELADEFGATPSPAAGVKVEVDRIVRPGAVVSGTVVFSDGKSANWSLDQSGRLMLDSSKTGYKPSQADIQSFQKELSAQLQRHGY